MARNRGRSHTEKTINMTFADIPSTNEAFAVFSGNQSLDSFANVARTCLSELQEKDLTYYTLPKDIQTSLIYYLSSMDGVNDLELYIPCLNLLRVLISSSFQQIQSSLVTHLCKCLEEFKHYEPTKTVVQVVYVLIDTVFHMALSRRKKSEYQDTVWIQQIFFSFTNILNSLITEPELREMAMAECGICETRASLESQVMANKKNTDLVLYLTFGINRLAKILTNTIPAEIFNKTIPGLIEHTIIEFRTINGFDVSGVRADICLEKSIAIFQLINTACSLTAKLDFGLELLKQHCDKLQRIFYLTSFEFFQRGFSVNSVKFEEDDSILGRIFKQIFEIMNNYLLHSEMESFPLQIFAIFIQQDMWNLLQDKPPIFQVFTQDFILKVLQKDLKNTKMSDTGIVNLLFSPSFFRLSGHTNLYCQYENTWSEIWNVLTEDEKNLDWIPACIVSSLKESKSDISYLLKINNWMHEVFEINPFDLDRYIKSGLLEEMLEGIITNYSLASNESVADFFISLKSILITCEVSSVSAKLVSLILQEDLIYDNSVSDLALTCLVVLMRQQEFPLFKKYLKILQEARAFDVQKKLLECIQNILNDSESRKWCQENFVEAGVLEIIRGILEKSYLQERTEQIWAACLECIRFIIQGNAGVKEKMSQLDMAGLSRLLMSDDFKNKRLGISEKTAETLFLILFNTSNLEGINEIVNPFVVPLLVTMMTVCHSPLSGLLVKKLKLSYNAAIFGMYSALEHLLEGLVLSENANVIKFIYEMISEVSSFSITPIVLKKIFVLSLKMTPEKQLFLYKSIYNGFNRAYTKSITEGYVLEPAIYSNFLNKETKIEFLTNDFEFLPKKEFSIITWVFIPDNSEGFIWEFCDKRSQFSLQTDSSFVILTYTYEKKTVFTIKSAKCIQSGSWNLICVCCQQVSKLMSTLTNMDIYINGNLVEQTTEGKISISHNFNSLYLGNNSGFAEGFSGKLSFFVILNKSFQEFSSLLMLGEDMHQAFMAGAVSAFDSFNYKVFKDFPKFKHFEYYSHMIPEYQHDIAYLNYSMIINQGNIIHSLSSIGGLQVFFPLFRETHSDQDLTLALLSLVEVFTKTKSIEAVLGKDFFEVLGNVLETCSPCPLLLSTINKILENLNWNMFYQKKVFTYLLCNPKIWVNMSDDLSDSYLKVLSEHVSKHYECTLENVIYLYSHLISLTPNPGPPFVQFFTKILPHAKKMTQENLDGVSFLILKIISDCSHIMHYFLEELSLIEIEKKCAQDFGFLVIYIMDLLDTTPVQSGAIRVFKTILLSLKEDSKEKKQDFPVFIFSYLDRKLDQKLSIEVFQSLMDVILTSLTCSKDEAAIFEVFCDIICKRFHNLDEKIIIELNKATSDYQFCEILVKRDNFSHYLYVSYLSEKDQTIKFALNLFKHTCTKSHTTKLRQFLLDVARAELTESLKIYNSSLLNLQQFGNFDSIECFLDFSSILEDMIDPEISRGQDLAMSEYTSVLVSLTRQASILSVLHCTFPSLPKIDFSVQYELVKQKPVEMPKTDNFTLREGGFLRLILKYIFIGLQTKPSSDLVKLLKEVLTAKNKTNSVILLDLISKQATDKKLTESNTDRWSASYSKFPARETDSFFSEEFLSFYLMIEITEILNSRTDDELLDFLVKLLQDINIERFLVSWSKRITSKELEDFYRLIYEFKYKFHSTARSRTHQLERNMYKDLVSAVTPQSLTTFQFCIYEQAENLGNTKKIINSVKDLITSPAWIIKVHFFIQAYTSMKLNFISSMPRVQQFRVPHDPVLSDEYSSKLDAFSRSKLEEIKTWQTTFNQSQDKFSYLYHQKYLEYNKAFKKLSLLFSKAKFKLRSVLDGLGRMATCCSQSNKDRFSFKRSKSVSVPVEQKFKASIMISNSTESSVGEESDTGTVVNEVEEDVAQANVSDKVKVVKTDCERIKVSYSLYGDLEVCKSYLLFTSEGHEKPADSKYFGSALKFTQETKKSIKFVEPTEVAEIFSRRFIHRFTAFELFLRNGKSYFFNVFTPEIREEVFEVFKSWRQVKVVSNDHFLPYIRFHQKKWKNGEISNFEYLMLVNKCAGRSFNDISQYPVFPWILKDYYSTELKLEDQHIYRNFKLPIGAQNENGRQEADRRFSMWIDEQPYHFGSHYSSGAIVLYYLIRIEPFTTQAKMLQGGKFDIADRLFHSIQACWESGQGVNGDVKEMIPELFYLPEMLANINDEDFGNKQDDETVAEVELPRWAESPLDFIRKHRQALESSYVSSNIHQWIDLIFGCKQKGKQAQNSYNLFCPMTYEDNFNKIIKNSTESESYLQGMVDQVVHFGQTPIKLFKSPHPFRETKPTDSNIFEKYKKLAEGVYYGCETNGQICALLMTSRHMIMIKNIYGRISIIKINLSEIEYSRVLFDEKKERILEDCLPYSTQSEEAFGIYLEKRIISGNQLDFSFKVHTLNGSLEYSVFGHTDYVTAVHCTKSFIVSGSKDSSLVSWEETKDKPQKLRIKARFLGHESEIAMIRSIENYQVLVSLAKDGKLIIHDLRSGAGIKGFLTDALGFSVSCLGVICCFDKERVWSFTVNNSQIGEKKIKVSKLIFDNTGENVYYYYGTSWGFFNVFDKGKWFIKDEQMAINHIQVPLGNEYLIFSKVNEKMNYVFTYELIQKENFRVIRKHNIFQDL